MYKGKLKAPLNGANQKSQESTSSTINALKTAKKCRKVGLSRKKTQISSPVVIEPAVIENKIVTEEIFHDEQVQLDVASIVEINTSHTNITDGDYISEPFQNTIKQSTSQNSLLSLEVNNDNKDNKVKHKTKSRSRNTSKEKKHSNNDAIKSVKRPYNNEETTNISANNLLTMDFNDIVETPRPKKRKTTKEPERKSLISLIKKSVETSERMKTNVSENTIIVPEKPPENKSKSRHNSKSKKNDKNEVVLSEPQVSLDILTKKSIETNLLEDPIVIIKQVAEVKSKSKNTSKSKKKIKDTLQSISEPQLFSEKQTFDTKSRLKSTSKIKKVVKDASRQNIPYITNISLIDDSDFDISKTRDLIHERFMKECSVALEKTESKSEEHFGQQSNKRPKIEIIKNKQTSEVKTKTKSTSKSRKKGKDKQKSVHTSNKPLETHLNEKSNSNDSTVLTVRTKAQKKLLPPLNAQKTTNKTTNSILENLDKTETQLRKNPTPEVLSDQEEVKLKPGTYNKLIKFQFKAREKNINKTSELAEKKLKSKEFEKTKQQLKEHFVSLVPIDTKISQEDSKKNIEDSKPLILETNKAKNTNKIKRNRKDDSKQSKDQIIVISDLSETESLQKTSEIIKNIEKSTTEVTEQILEPGGSKNNKNRKKHKDTTQEVVSKSKEITDISQEILITNLNKIDATNEISQQQFLEIIGVKNTKNRKKLISVRGDIMQDVIPQENLNSELKANKEELIKIDEIVQTSEASGIKNTNNKDIDNTPEEVSSNLAESQIPQKKLNSEITEVDKKSVIKVIEQTQIIPEKISSKSTKTSRKRKNNVTKETKILSSNTTDVSNIQIPQEKSVQKENSQDLISEINEKQTENVKTKKNQDNLKKANNLSLISDLSVPQNSNLEMKQSNQSLSEVSEKTEISDTDTLKSSKSKKEIKENIAKPVNVISANKTVVNDIQIPQENQSTEQKTNQVPIEISEEKERKKEIYETNTRLKHVNNRKRGRDNIPKRTYITKISDDSNSVSEHKTDFKNTEVTKKGTTEREFRPDVTITIVDSSPEKEIKEIKESLKAVENVGTNEVKVTAENSTSELMEISLSKSEVSEHKQTSETNTKSKNLSKSKRKGQNHASNTTKSDFNKSDKMSDLLLVANSDDNFDLSKTKKQRKNLSAKMQPVESVENSENTENTLKEQSVEIIKSATEISESSNPEVKSQTSEEVIETYSRIKSRKKSKQTDKSEEMTDRQNSLLENIEIISTRASSQIKNHDKANKDTNKSDGMTNISSQSPLLENTETIDKEISENMEKDPFEAEITQITIDSIPKNLLKKCSVVLEILKDFSSDSFFEETPSPAKVSETKNIDKEISDTLTSDRVKETSKSVKEISDSVKEASDSVKEASDSVKEASDSVKEASDSVKEASDSVKEASDSVKEASDSVKETSDSVKETSDSVKETSDSGRETSDCVNISLPLHKLQSSLQLNKLPESINASAEESETTISSNRRKKRKSPINKHRRVITPKPSTSKANPIIELGRPIPSPISDSDSEDDFINWRRDRRSVTKKIESRSQSITYDSGTESSKEKKRVKKFINTKTPNEDELYNTQHLRITENKSITIIRKGNEIKYVKSYDNDFDLKTTESDDNLQPSTSCDIPTIQKSLILERRNYITKKKEEKPGELTMLMFDHHNLYDPFPIKINKGKCLVQRRENLCHQLTNKPPSEQQIDRNRLSLRPTMSLTTNRTMSENLNQIKMLQTQLVNKQNMVRAETSHLSSPGSSNGSSLEVNKQSRTSSESKHYSNSVTVNSVNKEKISVAEVEKINARTTPKPSEASTSSSFSSAESIISINSEKLKEEITALTERVTAKQELLEKLKLAAVYKKKDNLEKLRDSTLQVKRGCQSALISLLMLLREHSDADCDMGTLLHNMNIPCEQVGYNELNDDFS